MTHDLTRQARGEIVEQGSATSAMVPAKGILRPPARRATVQNLGATNMYAAGNRTASARNEDIIAPGDSRAFDYDLEFIHINNPDSVNWIVRFQMGE